MISLSMRMRILSYRILICRIVTFVLKTAGRTLPEITATRFWEKTVSQLLGELKREVV